MDIGTLVQWALAVGAVFFILLTSVFSVEQQTVRIVERFGKFLRVVRPGLNFKLPLIDSVSAPFDMRLQQITTSTETKTKDNVFVTIDVAIQCEPVADKIYEAYYRLQNAKSQITSYVFNVVRAKVPSMTLDETFEGKDTIATAVKEELEKDMAEFGYNIVNALVVDIKPDEKVQSAMNEVQAATRLKEAAMQKAEADKIITVKQAEAESESKKLQGEGIAAERQAIVAGMKSAAEELVAAGVRAEDVMGTILLTQYFDTIKAIGDQDNTKVIFLPSTPAGMSQMANEIRTAVASAKEI